MKPIHIRTLRRLRRGAGTVVLLGILIPQLAVANPLGPQVVSGQASFAAQGKTLTVTNSDRAIINWQAFSIAGGEITRFIQPTATSAVLNRVIGNNPSAIYGALQSNGRVYLVNQSGIFMGPTATIDVNGLVASTLNITDSDFRAGRINFSGGPLAGRIENQGTIRTPAGGSIYLIAPDVANSGIINAPNGDVLLAAGRQVSLVESTTPEIAVVVSAPENQVLNLGRIIAEAGRVGIYGGLIRHRGIVSADSAVMDKTGAIHFRATKDITFDKDSTTTASGPKGGNITVQSAEGATLVSGAVEARGSNGQGGTIHILGTRVGIIDAAQIDASGENGGGTVLVGGDYQGKNPAVQNAEATYFGKDAVIRADALANGDGGKVILWGNEATRAYGNISARGGEVSGDGGFVETSGKYLDYRGFADLRGPRGVTGTLLLDPTDIVIGSTTTDLTLSGGSPNFTFDSGEGSPSQLLASDLNTQLGLGNVTVNTTPGTGGGGNITVSSPIVWTTASSLTLNADYNILIAAPISLGASGIIDLAAGNDLTVSNSITGGSGSTLTLSAGHWLAINAAITGGSGSTLTLDATTYTGPSNNGIINVSNLELLGGGQNELNNPSNNIGTLAGNVGSLSLTNSGALNIGQVNDTAGLNAAGTVKLDVGGHTITQTKKITAGSLETHSDGGTQLNTVINSVANFSATNTGAGHIKLKNDLPLTINGINNAGSGDIFIDNQSGSIYINGVMATNTTSGEVSLYAGAITAGGPFTHVQRSSLFHASASGGIGPLKTAVSEIDVSNSGTGNIDITNTGALNIIWLANTASGVGSGSILINNTGSVTTGSSLVRGYRDVAIIAGSPLTIGTGGVKSDAGNITLTAGATGPGVTTDIMTLNGPLTAMLDITLSAGNEIIENSTIDSAEGTITRTPNLNGSAPEPPLTCPIGQELIGGVCQPITCPTGQQLVGNTCQPITCPTGQQLVGNTCQPITCPTGQQLVGNTCQAITCPTGQQLVGNACQAITCPGGQVWAAGGCQCPAGTIDYAGICKTPSIMPGTDNGTVIYFPGTEKLTEPLQVLVQSIINAVNPSLLRTSGSGSPDGGAGDDPNKPKKKNYCN
ncbi:MAG: filamentous hemagglutinin N-terminal domain-containing protein [Pseudomonadota bacterium]